MKAGILVYSQPLNITDCYTSNDLGNIATYALDFFLVLNWSWFAVFHLLSSHYISSPQLLAECFLPPNKPSILAAWEPRKNGFTWGTTITSGKISMPPVFLNNPAVKGCPFLNSLQVLFISKSSTLDTGAHGWVLKNHTQNCF